MYMYIMTLYKYASSMALASSHVTVYIINRHGFQWSSFVSWIVIIIIMLLENFINLLSISSIKLC